MIEPEALQARLGRTLEPVLVDIVRTDLGGEEDAERGTREARIPSPTASSLA